MSTKIIITTLLVLGGLTGLYMLTKQNDRNTVTETPDEVLTAEEEATLPSEIPLYPEAEIERQTQSSSEESTDYSVSLASEDSESDIFAWYVGALSSNGWSIKSDKTVAGYRILQGENENLFTSIQANYDRETGITTISQSVKVRN